jgi:hypothetical protein
MIFIGDALFPGRVRGAAEALHDDIGFAHFGPHRGIEFDDVDHKDSSLFPAANPNPSGHYFVLQAVPLGEVQNTAALLDVSLNQPRNWRRDGVRGPFRFIAMANRNKCASQGGGFQADSMPAPGELADWCGSGKDFQNLTGLPSIREVQSLFS